MNDSKIKKLLSVNYGDDTLLDQYKNECLKQEFTHISTSLENYTLSFDKASDKLSHV